MIHPDCQVFVLCVETLLERRRAGLRSPAAGVLPANAWGPRWPVSGPGNYGVQ